jgi:hypothetical protein
MSRYTIEVELDGAVKNRWHGLSITNVGNLASGIIITDHHLIEEFLTDLMIECEATMTVWWSSTKVTYHGYKEN